MYVKHIGKRSVGLNRIPEFKRNAEEHQSRSSYHIEKGLHLEQEYYNIWADISKYDTSYFNFPGNRLTETARYLAHSNLLAYQKDERWANMPFGVVNTIGNAGSLIFCSDNLLILCSSLTGMEVEKPSLSYGNNEAVVRELTRLAVQKGYRPWKYENLPNALFLPKIKLIAVKEALANCAEIQNCKSTKEFEKILGKPVGIGGHMFFIDELIALIGREPTSPYRSTRLESFWQIANNIKYEIPVPMRVNNSIFYGDYSRTGGSYVICVGFENGNAIVVDANSKRFLRTIPVVTLYHSIVADHGLTCVWDASPIFRK